MLFRSTFDLYVLDSWDGLNTGSFAPDFFNVAVDGQRLFHEAFGNFATTPQTFRASAPVPLQIVPVITGLSGRPGLDFTTFDLTGSGFMEAASTLTIGGVPFMDQYTNLADFDVFGARNDTYRLIAPLTTEGPITVTTAGGSFTFPGPTFAPPAFVQVTGLQATAGQGRSEERRVGKECRL